MDSSHSRGVTELLLRTLLHKYGFSLSTDFLKPWYNSMATRFVSPLETDGRAVRTAGIAVVVAVYVVVSLVSCIVALVNAEHMYSIPSCECFTPLSYYSILSAILPQERVEQVLEGGQYGNASVELSNPLFTQKSQPCAVGFACCLR